ncbi:hypothetical protein [Metabacillus indicus]|uniref:hypothetical protein n=1 Tax=Metabacillus indicus TaxID=246786 RepID=UPI0004933A09|nr:hypothetical protein [Metabacillus indicus]KEZ52770.1 hypothetical protein AZ46_0203255 [Metabacillus indicus LMG 22858]MDX8291338.1 hypothetical protein [Metabacillus indicus]
MDKFTIALAILAFMIVAGGLIYTAGIGRLVDIRKSEIDTPMNEKIQRHPYIRNPIFLTYLIALGLVGFYILYLAFTRSW